MPHLESLSIQAAFLLKLCIFSFAFFSVQDFVVNSLHFYPTGRNAASSASSGGGLGNNEHKFMGEGQTFRGKLIGVLEVPEARGDRMCQDALQELKTAIKASGEHKQRIIIHIAVDGLKIKDDKSGVRKWPANV